MDRFATEEQQVEAIKSFWKEYGVYIVVGAVVGLLGLFGYRYYEDSQIARTAQASDTYSAIEQYDPSSAAVTQLMADFADTGYSLLAQLRAAAQAVADENWEQAKTLYQSLLASEPAIELAHVAALNLAKVHYQLEDYEAVLATTEQLSLASFVAQKNELAGDALSQLGRYAEAQQAYARAIDETSNPSPILQLKMDNLAHQESQMNLSSTGDSD